MQRAKLSDLVGIINKIAPAGLAEDWDNVGLQVGDPAMEIERVLVALDPVAVAVEEAISGSCQLLLTHHPLIFKPLKRISTGDETGRLLHRSIRSGLAIVSAHTNYDAVAGGINDLLVDALELTAGRPLKVMQRDELVKLAVYLPETHRDELLAALLPHAVQQGGYADCSFRVEGTGTFRPLAGARPFIGQVGSLASVAEIRLEILLRRAGLAAALKVLHKVHPYEVPAYDIVPLLNEGTAVGIGRVGELPEPMVLADFAVRVKERLGAGAVRLAGAIDRPVTRVALCGGSGAFLLRDAVREGADVLVTGDVKYHDAREAEALGIALVDAGHFATERLMVEGLARQLEAEVARRKLAVAVLRSAGEQDPFTFL